MRSAAPFHSTSATREKTAAVLGGALLAELALTEHVTIARRWFQTSKEGIVRTTGIDAPEDPVLGHVYERVAETSMTPGAMVVRVGIGQLERLTARLIKHGHVRRVEAGATFLSAPVTWPSENGARRREMQRQVLRTLVDDTEPDDRIGALAAFLAVTRSLDRLHPPPTLSDRALKRRARATARGKWAATGAVTAFAATTSVVGSYSGDGNGLWLLSTADGGSGGFGDGNSGGGGDN